MTEPSGRVSASATRGNPRLPLNPADYLAGMRGVLDSWPGSWLRPPPPEDPDDPATWLDPAADAPFTVLTTFTVTGNAIRYTWCVRYPLETYGLSTACSGGELARAACGVPVRGCSPSPLSSSIR